MKDVEVHYAERGDKHDGLNEAALYHSCTHTLRCDRIKDLGLESHIFSNGLI